jgi:predicted nucleic acid binding AN1-type Zn finger protein
MKCHVKDCAKRVVLIIGDCKYCENRYCEFHRIPESHQCTNMEACRKKSFEQNQARVMSEKTNASKMTYL